MQMALDEAKKAPLVDEIPIGAVIVNNATGEVIAKTHNLSEYGNCLGHAEVLAIQSACDKTSDKRLWGTDIYVTLEPCTMCAAAISFARIENVYFGAYDPKGGAVVNGVKFYEQATCHHRPNVQGGILEEECSSIIKDFFKQKRKES